MDPEGVVVDERGVVGNIRGHSPHMAENGDVWFTAIRGNKLGKWDRKTRNITLWEIPTAHSFPYGIEVDQQGIVWFAELFGCAVASFDPETEEFKEYPSLIKPCAINRLAADSKGTIWYSVASSGRLGRLDPATGAQKEYDILSFSKVKASRPYGIVADPDDKIWFGDGGLGGALVRFDPDTEDVYLLPGTPPGRQSQPGRHPGRRHHFLDAFEQSGGAGNFLSQRFENDRLRCVSLIQRKKRTDGCPSANSYHSN